MFGFGSKSLLRRYEVRNPKCAPIFHPLVTNGFLQMGETSNPRFSEDCFEDPQIREGLESMFKRAFQRKFKVGVDQHMAEVMQLHYDVLKETTGRTMSDFPENDGFTHAVVAIRMIAFGTAGGLAENQDNALAITADILFALARELRFEPDWSIAYYFGSTMKLFGMQFDAPVWSKCPPALAQMRRREWDECYPQQSVLSGLIRAA